MSAEAIKVRVRETILPKLVEGLSPEVELTPTPQGVEMTVTTKSGVKTAIIPKGDSYVLTPEDKEEIKSAYDDIKEAAEDAQEAAETAQGKAEDAQEAAEEVLESIPSDYSELSADVTNLKSAFDDTTEQTFQGTALTTGYRLPKSFFHVGVINTSTGEVVPNGQSGGLYHIYSDLIKIGNGCHVITTTKKARGFSYNKTTGAYIGADAWANAPADIVYDIDNSIRVVIEGTNSIEGAEAIIENMINEFSVTLPPVITLNSMNSMGLAKQSEVDNIADDNNIFSLDEIKTGKYYKNDGTLATDPTGANSAYTEEYCAVTAGKTYYFSCPRDGSKTLSICTYNSEKTFIERKNISESSGSVSFGNTVAYIRFSIYNGADVVGNLWIAETIVQYSLTDKVILSDRQLSQIKQDALKKNVLSWHGTYGQNYSGLYVFIPMENGYARYDFQYYYSSSDQRNADVWRINSLASAGNDLSERFVATINGEWECALKLNGRSDYMGGMMHGDEKFTSLVFLLDGIPFTAQELATYVSENTTVVFDKLIILEESTLYDPNDGITAVATHGKEYTFTKDNLTIKQCVDWLLSETLEDCYLAMMTPAKTYTGKFFTDKDFVPKTASSSTYGEYPNVKKVTQYSDSYGFLMSLEIPKYPTGYTGSDIFYLRDNGSTYNKGYFYVCSSGSVEAGTRWESESIYECSIGTPAE